jgi:hypothetical protein
MPKSLGSRRKISIGSVMVGCDFDARNFLKSTVATNPYQNKTPDFFSLCLYVIRQAQLS